MRKSLTFKQVMCPVIKTVNFFRARKLNHRQFQKFLDDLDTDHQDLLHFIEVRWLSKQGRNEVRRRPGQEASLPPPSSNLRPFGRKFTVLKKVLVSRHLAAPAVVRRPHNDPAPGELCAPCHPVVTPL